MSLAGLILSRSITCEAVASCPRQQQPVNLTKVYGAFLARSQKERNPVIRCKAESRQHNSARKGDFVREHAIIAEFRPVDQCNARRRSKLREQLLIGA